VNLAASPRVSVVMPAYQAAWSIGAAASSVLWQSFRDLELVVVDDGSTDRTAEIVAALDGPVRLIRQENAGVAAARNRGIEAATGELIAFCDADDLWFGEHLAALVELYDRAGGIATSNCYWLFPRGIHPSRTRYKGRFPEPERQRRAILEQNFVSTMSLFPRSLVEEVGPFDESLRRAEDWDFWLRAIYAGERVSLQRQPLALYRWGATGLSSSWREMDADIEAIFDGIEQRVALTDDEREYVARRRAGPGPRVLGREGDAALRGRSYREAARAYAEAAKLCPAERPLVWKARVLRAAPWLTGPLVRARQLRIEAEVGLEEGHQR
jgi:glycosyltransferase involved in cell wall biosynthesis